MILAAAMMLLTACQPVSVTVKDGSGTDAAPKAQNGAEPINLIWWVYSPGEVPKDMQKVLDRQTG